jgi:hypothetical protein
MTNETTLENGKQVTLVTEDGNIIGTICNYYTGSQKNQVGVKFEYRGHKCQWPFSRKTGKPYNFSDPKPNIRLII